MEGKKDFGCSYHKLCKFSHDRGKVQVDVFVMKVIAEHRPIAVTISNYGNDGSEVGREKLGFNGAEDVEAGAPTIAKALVSLGLAPESKAKSYAVSISEFITKDRDKVTAALKILE